MYALVGTCKFSVFTCSNWFHLVASLYTFEQLFIYFNDILHILLQKDLSDDKEPDETGICLQQVQVNADDAITLGHRRQTKGRWKSN